MILSVFNTVKDVAGMAMGAEVDVIGAVKDTANTVKEFAFGKCPG
jgi:hypothetical protein